MNKEEIVIKTVSIIFLLFFSNVTFGEFHTRLSYEESGLTEATLYRWSVSKYPLKVCVDHQIPIELQNRTREATDMWETALRYFYHKYVYPYSSQEERDSFVSLFFNLFDVYIHCKSKGIKPDVYVSRSRLNKLSYEHSLFYVKKTVVGRTNYETASTWLGLSYELDYIIIDFDQETPFNVGTVPRHNKDQLLINTAMHEFGHVLDLAHSKEKELMYWNGKYCFGRVCQPTEQNIYDFLYPYYLSINGENSLLLYILDVQLKRRSKGEPMDSWTVDLLSKR